MDTTSNKRFAVVSLILSFCLLFSSCESVNCPLNNIVESEWSFYASERDADGTFLGGGAVAVGDTLTVRALSYNLEAGDTVLLNRAVGKSGMSLPVSFYSDVDTLVFNITDSNGLSAEDTVWVSKHNKVHFDDPSCPVKMFHEVQAVRSTHQFIDTIVVVNAAVNYDGLENFQIYFYTDESE